MTIELEFFCYECKKEWYAKESDLPTFHYSCPYCGFDKESPELLSYRKLRDWFPLNTPPKEDPCSIFLWKKGEDAKDPGRAVMGVYEYSVFRSVEFGLSLLKGPSFSHWRYPPDLSSPQKEEELTFGNKKGEII